MSIPDRICLRENARSDIKCDECVLDCLLYTDEPAEENPLLVSDLEEMALENSAKPFVMFIK